MKNLGLQPTHFEKFRKNQKIEVTKKLNQLIFMKRIKDDF